jgi:hypothetical protein
VTATVAVTVAVFPYAPGDGEMDAESVPVEAEMVTTIALLLDAAKVESPL